MVASNGLAQFYDSAKHAPLFWSAGLPWHGAIRGRGLERGHCQPACAPRCPSCEVLEIAPWGGDEHGRVQTLYTRIPQDLVLCIPQVILPCPALPLLVLTLQRIAGSRRSPAATTRRSTR